jgi:hypothetical protein
MDCAGDSVAATALSSGGNLSPIGRLASDFLRISFIKQPLRQKFGRVFRPVFGPPVLI